MSSEVETLREELSQTRAEAAALRGALERLGASKAFTSGMYVDNSPLGGELKARIQFARSALNSKGAGE